MLLILIALRQHFRSLEHRLFNRAGFRVLVKFQANKSNAETSCIHHSNSMQFNLCFHLLKSKVASGNMYYLYAACCRERARFKRQPTKIHNVAQSVRHRFSSFQKLSASRENFSQNLRSCGSHEPKCLCVAFKLLPLYE